MMWLNVGSERYRITGGLTLRPGWGLVMGQALALIGQAGSAVFQYVGGRTHVARGCRSHLPETVDYLAKPFAGELAGRVVSDWIQTPLQATKKPGLEGRQFDFYVLDGKKVRLLGSIGAESYPQFLPLPDVDDVQVMNGRPYKVADSCVLMQLSGPNAIPQGVAYLLVDPVDGVADGAADERTPQMTADGATDERTPPTAADEAAPVKKGKERKR